MRCHRGCIPGGATAIPLATSFRSALQKSVGNKKEGRKGLRGEFLGRGLAGILCSLVRAGFPVIGGHQAYRWWADRHGWGGAYLGFLPFLAFPPPFFPVFVPFFTSCVASGCAATSSGSSWCFFWCLLAWSPAFDGPRLQMGVWARMWPLREALSSARVRGGIDWVWCVVWCVVVGRKK